MTGERRCYALAGAMSVETAELLRAVHRAAGPPGDAQEVPPRRRILLPAAARTYGAAAACSALVGRLLLSERDAAGVRLGDLPAPQVAERGVTALEESELATWRATVRATAAAAAEIGTARAAWRAGDQTEAHVLAALGRLADYVEEVSRILERSEPVA